MNTKRLQEISCHVNIILGSLNEMYTAFPLRKISKRQTPFKIKLLRTIIF